jgi:hypothetical protein
MYSEICAQEQEQEPCRAEDDREQVLPPVVRWLRGIFTVVFLSYRNSHSYDAPHRAVTNVIASSFMSFFVCTVLLEIVQVSSGRQARARISHLGHPAGNEAPRRCL